MNTSHCTATGWTWTFTFRRFSWAVHVFSDHLPARSAPGHYIDRIYSKVAWMLVRKRKGDGCGTKYLVLQKRMCRGVK